MRINNLKVREENIKKRIKGTSLILTVLVAGLLATGCAKEVNCNVKLDNKDHAHLYTTSTGFKTYRNSEYEVLDGSNWNEQYIEATDEINEMGKLGLFKITENLEPLQEQMDNDIPYTEYEYKRSTMMMIGKIFIPRTVERWTNDSEVSRQTGALRDVSHKYYGYKIGTDKKGNRVIIKSELVDDIFSVASEYPYFKVGDNHTLSYSESYTKEQESILKK